MSLINALHLLGDRAMLDTLRRASHVHGHFRNITDEVMCRMKMKKARNLQGLR